MAVTAEVGLTAAPVQVSVLIATYNRGALLARLLRSLAEQTVAASDFEVIVVDDGSTPPVRDALPEWFAPGSAIYPLRLFEQANAGPGAARNRAAALARGTLLVIVDDDMRISADFLAAHLAAHASGAQRVVLGRLHPETDTHFPLFERFLLAKLDRLADDAARGVRTVGGGDMYTGNVSMRRADYLAAGGFDPSFRLSEDAELGMRLERLGATFVISPAARSWHGSDHTSVARWMARARAYGAADVRVSAKHGGACDTSPWRFFFAVNPLSRPMLLLAALAPHLVRPVAWTAMRAAQAVAALGAERAGLAGVTFVYGLEYYAGVREQAGSARGLLCGLRRYLNRVEPAARLPVVGHALKCIADIKADHEAIAHADAKYKAAPTRARLIPDLAQKVGFQMMAAYRVMRMLRALRLRLLARVASRVIRHLYSADIHWDAELAPGVMLVHGTGLVIGHSARVGPGCILFHGVTLGESMHPDRPEVGSPVLERDVHVGPGAALLGPIVIGRQSKVAANAVVMRSLPARTLVEPAALSLRTRGGARARADTPASLSGPEVAGA